MKCVKTIVITFILTIILLLIVKYLLTHRIPVEIPLDHLKNILSPGTYEGNGYYSPTSLYPNGLNAKLYKVISESNNGLTISTNIKAYDAKTNKFVYDAVRQKRLDYKPSHGKEVFVNSLSYLNDGSKQDVNLHGERFPNENVVSSSHGHSIGKSQNKISFSSTGSWHISKQNFIHIHSEITKISPTKLVEISYNKNMFEITLMTMTETYTKIS